MSCNKTCLNLAEISAVLQKYYVENKHKSKLFKYTTSKKNVKKDVKHNKKERQKNVEKESRKEMGKNLLHKIINIILEKLDISSLENIKFD